MTPVVYHSSPYSFRKFDTSKEGAHFGTYEQAANLRKAGKREPKAYVLDIENPLRLRDIGVWDRFNNLHYALVMGDHITPEQAESAWEAWQRGDDEGWEALKQALKANGYDGIVYENEQEGEGDSYIAFWAHQIQPVRADRTVEDRIYRVAKRALNEILDAGDELPTRRNPHANRFGWKPVEPGAGQEQNEQPQAVPIGHKTPPNDRWQVPAPTWDQPATFLSGDHLDALMQRIKDEEAQPPHKQNAARIAGMKKQALEMMKRLEALDLQRRADKLLPKLEG